MTKPLPKRLQNKIQEAKKKQEMKTATTTGLLAIDPATLLGWAVSYTMYGTINFETKRDESAGIKFMRWKARLVELIQLNNVKIIAFERPSGNKPAALMSHARFTLIIETVCIELGLEFRGYSASEIKKFATGNGNASKELMIKVAQEKLGYTGTDNNEADALWILALLKSDLNI